MNSPVRVCRSGNPALVGSQPTSGAFCSFTTRPPPAKVRTPLSKPIRTFRATRQTLENHGVWGVRGGKARRQEAGLGDLTSLEGALTVLDPVAPGRMARTKCGFGPLFMRSACVPRFAIPIRRVRERGRIDHQVVTRSVDPGLDRVAKPTPSASIKDMTGQVSVGRSPPPQRAPPGARCYIGGNDLQMPRGRLKPSRCSCR